MSGRPEIQQRPTSALRLQSQDRSVPGPSVPDHERTSARSSESSLPDSPPPRGREDETWLRTAAHYAGLVLASMVGCLIRLGLNALGNYNGRVIFPLAWAQGVGCGIMGLASHRKEDIMTIYPPLQTFIATGVAGSVTTFSSWMLEGYLSFSNTDRASRTGFYDTVDGFAYSFATYLIALGGFHIGTHFGSLFPRLPPHFVRRSYRSTERHQSPSPSPASSSEKTGSPFARRTPLLDTLTILSAFGSYLIALLLYFLAPTSWRHRATFPILLAPPGAMLRYALSRLNSRRPFADKFPIGTFLANISATLLVSGVYAAQRLPSGQGATRCNALYAIQQGFCGCLSTVSTFTVESRTVGQKRWKWVYVGTSVVLGHVTVLAIVGGVQWTEGYGPVCSGG